MKPRLLAAFLCAGALGAHAASEFDTSFGNGGESVLDFAASSGFTRADGRLVFGGEVWSTDPQRGIFYTYSTRAAGLLANGSLDPAFVPPSAPLGDSCCGFAALQQPGEKPLFAGGVRGPNAGQYFLGLTRLLASGPIDASFGTSGQFVDNSVGAAGSLAVQADGAILVPTEKMVRRFLPDGGYDASFGTGGQATLPFPGPGVGCSLGTHRIATLAGNGVAVLVTEVCPSPANDKVHVSKLLSTGTPDPTFNGSGFVTLPAVSGRGLAALADGRLVVALQLPGVASRGRIVRLLANGSPDPAFGQGGAVDTVNVLAIGPVVVEPGNSVVALGSGLILMRWSADGTPEGRVWPILSRVPLATVLLPQADGGYVGAGEYSEAGTLNSRHGQAMAVRYRPGTTDMFADSRLFAGQQFRDFLYREGDDGGITYWAGRLDAAAITRAQLVRTFIESPEFQGVFAPIVRLYLAYFLRTPDYTGLQHWVNYARAGNSLEQISQLFAASPEFQQRYGNLDNASFVHRVYANVLGRNADVDGLQHWTQELESGRMTRGQVMVAFSESAEFQSLSFNEVMVTMSYVGMLRRGADTAGFDHWVGQMDQGVPPDSLIQIFLDAQEYRNRFLP